MIIPIKHPNAWYHPALNREDIKCFLGLFEAIVIARLKDNIWEDYASKICIIPWYGHIASPTPCEYPWLPWAALCGA